MSQLIVFWLPIVVVSALLLAQGYRALIAFQAHRAEQLAEDEHLATECLATGKRYAAFYVGGAIDSTFDVSAARRAMTGCFEKGKPTSPPGGWTLP